MIESVDGQEVGTSVERAKTLLRGPVGSSVTLSVKTSGPTPRWVRKRRSCTLFSPCSWLAPSLYSWAAVAFKACRRDTVPCQETKSRQHSFNSPCSWQSAATRPTKSAATRHLELKALSHAPQTTVRLTRSATKDSSFATRLPQKASPTMSPRAVYSVSSAGETILPPPPPPKTASPWIFPCVRALFSRSRELHFVTTVHHKAHHLL